MNVHHLELFYYVARYGGIAEAVRKMPYGIQQPAVSGQVRQLEDSVGGKLFHRRPFSLTPMGRELFEFIEPFFGQLQEISARLRRETSQRLRLAAPATVLRDHLPELLERHRRRFPELKVTLHETNQAMAEAMLERHEIDLAITQLEGKPPRGIKTAVLVRVPLVLLLPTKSRLRAAAALWKKQVPDETLIALPTSEAISRLFQQGLRSLGVKWSAGVEVSSLELIEVYVAGGFGVGVSVHLPRATRRAGIRELPLPGFPPLILAAMWQERLAPVAESFLTEVRKRAQDYLSAV